MSASMYWRPAPQLPEGEHVDDRLRRILAQKLWGEDGSLSHPEGHVLDETWIPYLQGLADAGVPDAEDLIEGIRRHKEVEVIILR